MMMDLAFVIVGYWGLWKLERKLELTAPRKDLRPAAMVLRPAEPEKDMPVRGSSTLRMDESLRWLRRGRDLALAANNNFAAEIPSSVLALL